jgi:anti-sigma B factor antagonist
VWAKIPPVAGYERLEIEVEHEGSRTMLRLRGELDMPNASLLQRELETADVEGAAAVLVDLRELHFMDSSGLRLLLTTNERLRRRGVEFAVAGVSHQVERLFSVTDAASHLTIVDPPSTPGLT